MKGITSMAAANRYLKQAYLPAFNAEFMKPAMEQGTAFVPWVGSNLKNILCEHYARTVSPDNCISFKGKILQVPADKYRCNYVRVKHGSTGIQMARCQFFMGRDGWQIIIARGA